MATPGICVSTSLKAELAPAGRLSMSSEVIEYWFAPVGDTAGPASRCACTVMVSNAAGASASASGFSGGAGNITGSVAVENPVLRATST